MSLAKLKTKNYELYQKHKKVKIKNSKTNLGKKGISNTIHVGQLNATKKQLPSLLSTLTWVKENSGIPRWGREVIVT